MFVFAMYLSALSNLISDIFVFNLHCLVVTGEGRSLMGHCPARGRRAHLLPLKEPPTCLLTGPCPPYTTICWTTTSILLPCRIKPATDFYMPDHANHILLYAGPCQLHTTILDHAGSSRPKSLYQPTKLSLTHCPATVLRT